MSTNWLSALYRRLRPIKGEDNGGGAAPSGDAATIKQMVRGIVSSRPDELGCDECFEQVDRFADLVLDGRKVADAMPLVEDHLERCGDCREEFEALLEALRALT